MASPQDESRGPRARVAARASRRWLTVARHRWVAARPAVRLVAAAAAVLAMWWTANGIYQVLRKPSEVFFPLGQALVKSPAETWQEYAPLFRAHSTPVMTPELLAALAQAEAAGNPVARTYWRWQPSLNPFEIYRPASTAVGMYQLTDAAFEEARRYCIHSHAVAEAGAWTDPDACWFNAIYTRVVPSHAVELTAALLDRTVARTLARNRIARASLRQRQDLAAVIHLCGAGAGNAYARRGFRLAAGQRCGDHDPARYLARIESLKRQFARLAAAR